MRNLLAAAAIAAGCALTACGSSDDQQDSSVAFSQITGDDFTSNPGAFQTDGVPVPEKGVTVVGKEKREKKKAPASWKL